MVTLSFITAGQYKALIIDISLNSACYATMALREVLKIDTSTSAQLKLNNYHDKNKEVSLVKDEHVDEQTFNGTSSLLNDQHKYELFKKCIFDSSETAKRKNEEAVGNETKKSKVSDDKAEENLIKIGSSLT